MFRKRCFSSLAVLAWFVQGRRKANSNSQMIGVTGVQQKGKAALEDSDHVQFCCVIDKLTVVCFNFSYEIDDKERQ